MGPLLTPCRRLRLQWLTYDVPNMGYLQWLIYDVPNMGYLKWLTCDVPNNMGYLKWLICDVPNTGTFNGLYVMSLIRVPSMANT
jgi:hypothetical protein